MDFQVFPDGQLGGDNDLLSQARQGAVEFCQPTGQIFSSILPNFTNWLPAWWGVYGWFFGVAIAGAVYYVLRTAALGAGAKTAKA